MVAGKVKVTSDPLLLVLQGRVVVKKVDSMKRKFVLILFRSNSSFFFK